MMSYSFVATLRFLIHISGAATFFLRNKRADSASQDFTPFVSVLLPAFNEAKVIEAALKNFEKIDYKNFEVLVIDDGSEDETFEKAEKLKDTLCFPLRVFRKRNGGKADALNFGIAEAKGEFILCMDSDSILSVDTIKKGIINFANNEKLAAVGGMVHVLRSSGKMIERFQQLDYLVGHFQKKALSLFGKVSIVPGPIGLFRKSAVLEVGGYEAKDETFAEDAEITLRLIAAGWSIVCSDEMKSFTEVPQEYSSLLQQRYRWSRGVYKALLKNLNNIKVLDVSSNVFLTIYLLWELVFIPLFNISILFSFFVLFLLGDSIIEYSIPMLYVLSLDLIIACLATRSEGKFSLWVVVALSSRIFYANILLVWNFFSLLDEWHSIQMSWDKLERTGLSSSDDKGAAA